jgi:uncharacterized protein (TIGR02246 family)
MRTGPCIAAAIVLIAGAAGHSRADETTAPQAVLQQWCESLEAGALDRVLTCYEDSDEVVVILSWGVTRTGTAALRKEYEAAFDEVVFESVQLEDLSVHTEGKFAWAIARVKADTKKRSDGSLWRLEIRTSFVMKQVNRRWLITLEHSSAIAGVDRVRRRE